MVAAVLAELFLAVFEDGVVGGEGAGRGFSVAVRLW